MSSYQVVTYGIAEDEDEYEESGGEDDEIINKSGYTEKEDAIGNRLNGNVVTEERSPRGEQEEEDDPLRVRREAGGFESNGIENSSQGEEIGNQNRYLEEQCLREDVIVENINQNVHEENTEEISQRGVENVVEEINQRGLGQDHVEEISQRGVELDDIEERSQKRQEDDDEDIEYRNKDVSEGERKEEIYMGDSKEEDTIEERHGGAAFPIINDDDDEELDMSVGEYETLFDEGDGKATIIEEEDYESVDADEYNTLFELSEASDQGEDPDNDHHVTDEAQSCIEEKDCEQDVTTKNANAVQVETNISEPVNKENIERRTNIQENDEKRCSTEPLSMSCEHLPQHADVDNQNSFNGHMEGEIELEEESNADIEPVGAPIIAIEVEEKSSKSLDCGTVSANLVEQDQGSPPYGCLQEPVSVSPNESPSNSSKLVKRSLSSTKTEPKVVPTIDGRIFNHSTFEWNFNKSKDSESEEGFVDARLCVARQLAKPVHYRTPVLLSCLAMVHMRTSSSGRQILDPRIRAKSVQEKEKVGFMSLDVKKLCTESVQEKEKVGFMSLDVKKLCMDLKKKIKSTKLVFPSTKTSVNTIGQDKKPTGSPSNEDKPKIKVTKRSLDFPQTGAGSPVTKKPKRTQLSDLPPKAEAHPPPRKGMFERSKSVCEENLKKKVSKSPQNESVDFTSEKHANVVPPLICYVCREEAKCLEDLEIHMSEHKIQRGFICDQCGASFFARQSFVKHLDLHKKQVTQEKKNVRDLLCFRCSETFPNFVALKKHISMRDAGVGCFKKKANKNSTNSSGIIKKDMNGTLGSPSYNTEPIISDDEFSAEDSNVKKESLKKHLCKICGDNFETVIDLDDHVALCHFKGRKYYCHECSRHFCLERTLDMHHKSEHQKHKCRKCQLECVSFEHLEEHLSIFHGEKKHVLCDECGADFILFKSLKDHMKYEHDISCEVTKEQSHPEKSLNEQSSCAKSSSQKAAVAKYTSSSSCTQKSKMSTEKPVKLVKVKYISAIRSNQNSQFGKRWCSDKSSVVNDGSKTVTTPSSDSEVKLTGVSFETSTSVPKNKVEIKYVIGTKQTSEKNFANNGTDKKTICSKNVPDSGVGKDVSNEKPRNFQQIKTVSMKNRRKRNRAKFRKQGNHFQRFKMCSSEYQDVNGDHLRYYPNSSGLSSDHHSHGCYPDMEWENCVPENRDDSQLESLFSEHESDYSDNVTQNSPPGLDFHVYVDNNSDYRKDNSNYEDRFYASRTHEFFNKEKRFNRLSDIVNERSTNTVQSYCTAYDRLPLHSRDVPYGYY